MAGRLAMIPPRSALIELHSLRNSALSDGLANNASSDQSTRNAVWIHRLALGTAFLSLLPIVMGSLVTTLGAGMAFLDWPTSDGQNMLTYPWLESHGDQFIEHGHRLAGMLIGFCGIGLVVAAWKLKTSTAIKRGVVIALLGIIIQGLIGGARVLLDQHVIAMGHSIFGCVVFVVLWEVAGLTSVKRFEATDSSDTSGPHIALGILWPLLCGVQYVAGAFLRHLGLLMHEHVGGAVLVTLGGIAIVIASRHSCRNIKRRSYWVAGMLALQVLFGLAVFAMKYGFAPIGLVATQRSLGQIVFRSLHTVGGMCVIAAGVAWSRAVISAALQRAQQKLAMSR